MPMIRTGLAGLILLAGLASAQVRAAESFDNCTGFIETLPASITTQGTWCLAHDVSTAITSGAAISIGTNNVTLDCNDFKVGGLAAGIGTNAIGITSDRLNVTVRNCRVRGFRYGVLLTGDYALIENNRLDLNTEVGLVAQSEGAMIRGNSIMDTGGRAGAHAVALESDETSHVIDNTIAGVTPDPLANTSAFGIFTFADSSKDVTIEANRIHGLVPGGTGERIAIYADTGGKIVADNRIGLMGATSVDIGVACSAATVIKDNVVTGVGSGLAYELDCFDGGGNVAH